MWRNSSKLFSHTRSNSALSAPFSPIHGVRKGGEREIAIFFSPPFFSHIHSIPSPLDSLKLGLHKSQSSVTTAFDLSSSASVLSPSSISAVTDTLRHYGRCYWELSKARLSMLVVATSGAGFVLGSGGTIDFAGLCWTCAGTMMVAASANSLNQVFEINNDAKMKRTRQRPLPSGRISVPHATMWASSVGIAGTTLLALKANALTAGLSASTLGLYAFVYTPLKQIHPVNTWVGAIVGAIPPLLGWTAASGQVSLNGMILPAALYFWQIPHFMALAFLCRNDYVAGGFKMFSLADASGQRTAFVALRNCLYLLPLGFLAYNWGLTSEWFCIESSLFTLFMSAGALLFCRERTARNARRMFHSSLLYLPVFMAGLLLHRLPNSQEELTTTDSDMLVGLSLPKRPVQRENPVAAVARPPVAYASVAPFPFLPAPSYVFPDS